MQKAQEIFFESDLSVDLFVYTEGEFNDWKNELNSIAEVAHNLGQELPLGQ